MTTTTCKALGMRGLGIALAAGVSLVLATSANAVPAPRPADYQAVQTVKDRLALHGWACDGVAVEGPRAIMRTAERVVAVRGDRVRPLMRAGSQILAWCRAQAPTPRDPEPIAVGTETNPLFVHNQPNVNEDGGSWAWADYGLYQVLRATRPSPAAKALCQLDAVGESIWISGGMMSAGQWKTVSVTVFNRQPSDVDILVDDADGTHGGSCSAGGLVLRKVG